MIAAALAFLLSLPTELPPGRPLIATITRDTVQSRTWERDMLPELRQLGWNVEVRRLPVLANYYRNTPQPSFEFNGTTWEGYQTRDEFRRRLIDLGAIDTAGFGDPLNEEDLKAIGGVPESLPFRPLASVPSIGSGWMIPQEGLGVPGMLDRFNYLGPPRVPIYVWFERTWLDYHVGGTKTFYEGIAKPFAMGVGCAAGFSFYEVPYDQADIAFFLGTPQRVAYWSQQYKVFGPKSTSSSVYYAAHPNRKDIYIGTHFKPSMGGAVIESLHGQHFMGYSLLLKYGPWGPQRADASIISMRNPNLSGPIYYPAGTLPNWQWYGRGGWDQAEIGFLQGLRLPGRSAPGQPWIARWDRSLTPATTVPYSVETPWTTIRQRKAARQFDLAL